MTRSTLAMIGACAVLGALAATAPASASTSTPFHAVLKYQFGGPNSGPRACDGCFTGEVNGLGRVTTAPGDDGLVITLSNGTITLGDGAFLGCSRPGHFQGNPGSYGNPGECSFEDTIAGGTGAWAGVTGTLLEIDSFAGGNLTILLDGTLQLP